MPLSTDLAAVDSHLKAGQIAQAQRLVRKLFLETIPRPQIAAFASLARRSGHSDYALKALNRLVRPSARSTARSADDAEKIEYAAALVQVGAGREALEILDQVDAARYPEAQLHRAFAYFRRWEYGLSLPCLRDYLRSALLTDYQRLVGEVNLAAALVYERQKEEQAKALGQEAWELLQKLLVNTKAKELQRLHINSLELAAQNSFYEKSWTQAEKFLSQAEKLISGQASGIDYFYIRKWRSFVEINRYGWSSSRKKTLNAIRREASLSHDWESVRDCDFHEALISRNRALFTHLYFGTPYRSFQERVKKHFLGIVGAEKEFPPLHYEYRLGGSQQTTATLDAATGQNSFSELSLKTGQLPQRLLLTLCRDFYAGWTVPGLYAELAPDNLYHPLHSANIVHQALSRLRHWIQSARIPLEVSEHAGHFRLRALVPLQINIHYVPVLSAKESSALARLKKSFGSKAFKAADVATELGLSLRSVNRLLLSLEKRSKLTRQGRGQATLYQIL